MNCWVRVRGTEHHTIAEWCDKRSITYEYHNGIINHITYTIDYDWLIADEKERIMFALKWCGT